MNDLTKEDARYKPYALRRLSDFAPEEKTEGPEGLVTAKQLKSDIVENLDMLFNSRSHASLADLKGYEEVEDSVLGYGLSDFCGRQSSTASREDLRANIFKQITLFEPRLDPASLAIELRDTGGAPGEDSTSIEFSIDAQVKTKEVSEEIYFISKLNLESGSAELRLETK